MSCKVYCKCPRCVAADEKLREGKAKRFLPKHIMNEIAEKRAAEEELMLWKGFLKHQCPACLHWSYMKIAPVMKCVRCCNEIS